MTDGALRSAIRVAHQDFWFRCQLRRRAIVLSQSNTIACLARKARDTRPLQA
jgi:hypothetical protein